MEVVKARNLIIGKGRPKICVPIVAATREEILDEAGALAGMPVDLAEWRVDWYEDAMDLPKVLETAGMAREILGDTPF